MVIFCELKNIILRNDTEDFFMFNLFLLSGVVKSKNRILTNYYWKIQLLIMFITGSNMTKDKKRESERG